MKFDTKNSFYEIIYKIYDVQNSSWLILMNSNIKNKIEAMILSNIRVKVNKQINEL